MQKKQTFIQMLLFFQFNSEKESTTDNIVLIYVYFKNYQL